MTVPEPFSPIATFDEAWRLSPAGARLDAIRNAAREFHDVLHQGNTVKSVRTYDLITLPYPTRYGLGDAARSPWPFLMITNRMQLVTFVAGGETRRLLVNPSDHERDAETPFFKRLAAPMPGWVNRRVARRHSDVPRRLTEAGLRGDQIDYLTFDHLHTQDLRRLMLEWCPRAQLLIMREELAIFERLHPLQSDWYLPHALDGIPRDRIVVLDRDVLLGEDVALLRTPGHTLGNHSIVLHTDRGVWAISENGVACDNYVPEKSDLAGLSSHARSRGVEVILNSNTRELSLEQYTSMVLEKNLVDPCGDGSGFVQHFPSSELTAHPLLPGLHATYSHRAITHGPEPA